MAYTLAQAYEIGRACARLEHAALARTLTNNPAPGLSDTLDLEGAAMLALLAGDGVVVQDGSSVLVSNPGGQRITSGQVVNISAGQPLIVPNSAYALLTSGALSVPATGTGTTVTLAIEGGEVSAVTLS